MLEAIIHILADGLTSISKMLGNLIVRYVFPDGFIEQDSLLSGTIGFITYLLLIFIAIYLCAFYIL